MNRCPKCGKMFEGNFCPECGRSLTGERLCPNCKKKVPATAKFCAECGFALTPQVKPKAKKKSPKAWIEEHKKFVIVMAIVLVLVLVLSIAIPVAVHNRHNGTYYLYENEAYNYEKYFILNGNSYTDEKGYTCDVEFDGNRIKMYAELFGMKDVTAEGTIEGNVLKLKIMGAEVTYAKKGAMHEHNFGDWTVQTPSTCTKYGTEIRSCKGCKKTETRTLNMIDHDYVWQFDKATHWKTCSMCKQSIDNDEHETSAKQCGICGYEIGSTVGLSYNIGEDACTVIGLGSATDKEIVIPSQYGGKPVIRIGDRAFYECRRLTSIDIPDSVISIGEETFYRCSGLTSITIGSGVTSIGERAFLGCSGLTEIKVDSNNQTYHAKNNCLIETNSKTLIVGCKTSEIPDDGSVTSIGDGAFAGCSGLTSIDIPDSVTEIGSGAFNDTAYYNNKSNWTGDVLYIGNHLIKAKDTISGSYSIREGTKTIANNAFLNCGGLTSVTIGSGVTSIGKMAFAGCYGLTSIEIPDSVTSIGYEAFSSCSELTSVTIGSGVTSIGDWAFEGCYGLTSIEIPDSVTSIGDWAFADCSGLTSVTIGSGVTSIGDEAFYDCSRLTSVTIGSGVTSIGDYAFADCSGLTSIDIPDSVISIGDGAFSSCSELTYVNIPDGVTSIGYAAFAYCSGLTSVTIGSGVTSIGVSAFQGCSGLKEVNFENPNGWKVSTYNDMRNAKAVSESKLKNPTTAAKYLTSFDYYCGYYWKRG